MDKATARPRQELEQRAGGENIPRRPVYSHPRYGGRRAGPVRDDVEATVGCESEAARGVHAFDSPRDGTQGTSDC